MQKNSTYGAKTVVTGNPVRPAVLEAAEKPYVKAEGDAPFNLVVFGGSQGAQHFSSILPTAICLLTPERRARLNVTQQARPEDEARVREAFGKLGVKGEVAPFFADMAERMAEAQLVVSRSGASTVSELAVIGRPAVLVPYPYALDHDQTANAAAIQAGGGAIVVKQAELSAEKLSTLLTDWMDHPQALASMARAAKQAGQPQAADLLADLVVSIAETGKLTAKDDAK